MSSLVSFPAILRHLLGIDPVPMSDYAAYAQLAAMCQRDHPASEAPIVTNDALYAYFATGSGVEASVVVQLHRRYGTANSVKVNLTGAAYTEDIDLASDIVADAFTFAACCKRQMKSWGLLS